MSDYQQGYGAAPQPTYPQASVQPAGAIDAGYVVALEQRVRTLEARVAGNGLLAPTFMKRAWAVWGHNFVASLVLGLIVWAITFVVALLISLVAGGSLLAILSQIGQQAR